MKKILIFMLTSLLAVSHCFAEDVATPAKDPDPNASKNSPPPTDTSSRSKEYFINHLTGNFDVTNNYVFRGISQTANEPAFQGGLTFTFDSHFYINIWGSNVNFLTLDGNTATLEADAVAGYANKFNDDLSYDFHFVRYLYPRASDANYNELIGSATYKILVGLIGWSSNVFNSGGPGTYVNLGFNIPIAPEYIYFDGVSLLGGVGYYHLNPTAGNSYKDYNIQIQKAISEKYVLAVQWTSTDKRFNFHPYDNSQIVVMFLANF